MGHGVASDVAGCRVASCRSTSASASCLYDALRPSFVLLQCNLCLSLSLGAAGFRDYVASCMLVPSFPFASRTPVGCRDASRCAATAASCPLDKPAGFQGATASCLLTPLLLFASRLPGLVVMLPLAAPPPLDVPPPPLDMQPLHLDAPSPLVHWHLSSRLPLVRVASRRAASASRHL